MSRKVLKYISMVLLLLIFICMYPNGTYAQQDDNILTDISYREYLDDYSDKPDGTGDITIEAVDFKDKDGAMDIEILNDYDGMSGKALYTGEEGYIEWEFDIPESGMYSIEVLYYPAEGKGNTIERIIYIDGEIPYKEARNIYLSRVWSDEGEISQDGKGNDIRPGQMEAPEWRTTILDDSLGYFNEPFVFYLEKGTHTIGFKSVREPVIFRSIRIYNPEQLKSYDEIKAEYEELGYSDKNVEPIIIQAQDAFKKSDNTLYPMADRSSAITTPQHPSKIRLNTISGTKWKLPRQWITWKFNIEESGLYKIALRYRQNLLSGLYVNRKIILDGEVPFKEAEAVKFPYDRDWKVEALGDDEQEFVFYLEEGEHELTMEVTLGELANVLNTVNDCLLNLNEAYRKILMITGTNPDLYRDYSFRRLIPDAIEILADEAKVLRQVSADMEKYIGEKGENIVILDKVALLLEQMSQKPEENIAKSFQSFRENVGALGSWILTVGEQPLTVDYLSIMPVSAPLPSAEGSFFQRISFETQAFVRSFFEDYNSLGSPPTSEEQKDKDILDVWITTGRDQAQIIRELINDSYTPETSTNVNIKLVAGDTLLPSVLAGTGPDIALGNAMGDPIQYAIRNAVENIEDIPGFDEVATRFHESALVPYTFEGKVYAVPETQSFPMMFYRKDIMYELGLEVPQTWDEFYEMIPEIQKHNMEIGFPQDLSGMLIFLYQNGGELYTSDRSRSTLDHELTIEAFQKQIELFTIYNLPRDYDFANRFRTGEMPIGIADYTTYNFLIAFAPEIRGLWEFVPIPGTRMADGTIKRTAPAGGTGAMILKGVEDKGAAFDFLEWWTRAETQSRFAMEMESILGQSAKQATSNMEALINMPWTKQEHDNLMAQWEHVIGIPEVPGGYSVSRAIDFASAAAYINGDPEVILDYVVETNDEISRKRREFGLE